MRQLAGGGVWIFTNATSTSLVGATTGVVAGRAGARDTRNGIKLRVVAVTTATVAQAATATTAFTTSGLVGRVVVIAAIVVAVAA